MNEKPINNALFAARSTCHDLIEAYRALEERGLASVLATESPGSEVWVIFGAMEQHRRSCPICTLMSANAQQVTRTMYLLR
jgi:hypothetical protein